MTMGDSECYDTIILLRNRVKEDEFSAWSDEMDESGMEIDFKVQFSSAER